jgi:uncharacterized YceG family protein
MAFGRRRQSGERSAEERARAAAERAARRAQPLPPAETFQEAVPPDRPESPASDRAEPPAFDRPERPSFDGPEAPSFDRPEPPASDHSDASDDRATGWSDRREDAYDLSWDEPVREPTPAVTAVEDRPPAPRRVPSSRRPVRRRPPPRPRTSGSWGRRVLAVLALAAIGAALYLINATFQPFHGDGSGQPVKVLIPENTDAGTIGDLLAEKGVVASGGFFELNATLTGRRGKLRPGEYTLTRDMSYGDALAALEKGPKVKVVPTVNVTVPEGLSIREAAPVVDKGPLRGSYRKAASERRVLRRVRRLGAPRGTRTAEGFLFPATYTLVANSPARDLVSKQLAAFEDNFKGLDMRYARRKNLTRYDVLIIASLIEREVQIDRERPLVAAVIYNRLAVAEPLGIDATIRYEKRNWDRPLRVSELEEVTPYNTRKVGGLPPTPIGNPGRKSLEAAANPAREDYLFYVIKPCGKGAHNFSTNNADFERDAAAYEAKRKELGGRSPVDC